MKSSRAAVHRAQACLLPRQPPRRDSRKEGVDAQAAEVFPTSLLPAAASPLHTTETRGRGGGWLGASGGGHWYPDRANDRRPIAAVLGKSSSPLGSYFLYLTCQPFPRWRGEYFPRGRGEYLERNTGSRPVRNLCSVTAGRRLRGALVFAGTWTLYDLTRWTRAFLSLYSPRALSRRRSFCTLHEHPGIRSIALDPHSPIPLSMRLQ